MKANKHTWFLCIPAFAAMLLSACQLENNLFDEPGNEIGNKLTVMASWEDSPQTRTAIQEDGVTVLWTPREEINLFQGASASGYFVSNNSEPCRKVELEGFLSGEVDPSGSYWAVYPYNEANTCNGASVTLTVPSIQTASEGTFADKFFPAVAHSNDLQMTFYNVCGGAAFTVANEGITSLEFQSVAGEPLVGKVTVSMDGDGHPVIDSVAEGSSSVTVSLPGGAAFEVGKRYYAVFLPGTLSKGLSIKYRKDNQKSVFLSNSSITLNRSRFGKVFDLDRDLTFVDSTIPEAVDLGLSVKWASFNLGATMPEGFGDYYMWGETETYYSSLNPLTWKEGKEAGYSWTSYKWCMGTEDSMTKYCTNSENGYNGFRDDKNILDPEDDAARAILGDKWRMPTGQELHELMEKCLLEETRQNGVYGLSVKGPNGNTLFLPGAGFIANLYKNAIGSEGIYMTSSIMGPTVSARTLIFWAENIRELDLFRGYGSSIRPVYDESMTPIPVEGVSLDQSSIEISIGRTATLTATVLPRSATNKSVTWSSSDESVATVSSSGVVKGISVGTATITATTVDGGKTAKCSVTVIESPPR